MSAGEVTAKEVRARLHGLGRRPAARGIHGDIKLVGDAAWVLECLGNRPTPDIDAGYASKSDANTIVAEMAAEYDLAGNWLNSNATPFIPDNATWVTLEQIDGLTTNAADLAFDKYGDHSSPHAASRDNYLIVDDNVATTLEPDSGH